MLCSHLDSFRYTPELQMDSDGSCRLNTVHCRVADCLATIQAQHHSWTMQCFIVTYSD